MGRLLRQRALTTPRQQLLHPSRLTETLRLNMLVELRRLDLAVRYRAVPVLDQRARPAATHAQAAPSRAAGTAFLPELFIPVVDGRVAEGERNLLPLGLGVIVSAGGRLVGVHRRPLHIVLFLHLLFA